MANALSGMSRLAALSEAVRHLEAQTLPLEWQLCIPLGDFDTDSASAIVARAGRLLQQLHNSAQRAVRLPAEILCMIFLALRDAYQTTQRNVLKLEVGPRDSDGWMKVTRVCRVWRSVAMNYAPLWSMFRLGRGTAPPRDTDKLQAFLNNSKTSALTIEAATALSSSAHALILRNASRLQRVRLRGSLEADHLELLATQDAPKLEALELYSVPKDPKSELPTLFNGIHPQLKTLALTGSTCLKSNLFPDLKHLCLAHRKYASLGDIERFVDLLQNLSKLEQLVFIDNRVNVAVTPSQLTTFSRRAIVLSNLQRVILAGVAAPLVNVILSVISVPPGQTLPFLFPSGYATSSWAGSSTDLCQLQGPGWEGICGSTHSFAIVSGHHFVVHSEGRELSFTGWNISFDSLSTAFGPAISHARELWIRANLASRDYDVAPPDRLLEAFLPYARAATAVYLDINLPRADSIFGLLHAPDPQRGNDDIPQYFPVPAEDDFNRDDMELHVKINSDRPKAFRQVREFREAVSNDDNIYYITDIRVYTSECKESLKLQKWAEKANDRECETHPPVHVVTADEETLPELALSTAFSAPCPFHWSTNGYDYY